MNGWETGGLITLRVFLFMVGVSMAYYAWTEAQEIWFNEVTVGATMLIILFISGVLFILEAVKVK